MFHSKVWIMLIIKLIIWNLATFLPMSQTASVKPLLLRT